MTNDLDTTITALELEQGLRFVGVQFPSEDGIYRGKVYTRKTLNEHQPGDILLVEVRDTIGLARVSEMDVDFDFSAGYFPWVLGDVTHMLEARKEQKTREKQVRKNIIRKRMLHEAKRYVTDGTLNGLDTQLLGKTTIEDAEEVVDAGDKSSAKT